MYSKAMERLKYEEEYQQNIIQTFQNRKAKEQREIMQRLNKKISQKLEDEFESFKEKKEKEKPHTKEEIAELLRGFNG